MRDTDGAPTNDSLDAKELQRPESLQVDEYNKIVAAAELEEIKLIKSSFFVAPAYFSETDAEKKEFSIDRSVSEPHYDKDSGQLMAGFDYSIDVVVDDKPVLKCAASFLVVFVVHEKFDEGSLKYFARRTGRSASYPYFRQYAATQSWASGADLPILPFLKTSGRNANEADAKTESYLGASDKGD